jgi:type IV pilus assembly protein PilC
MAEFVCKVGDPTGKVFQQVETAQSEAEARQKLVDRGLFVFSIRSHIGIFSQLGKSRRDRVVKGSDFLIFNQQFNTLVKAGLPILKALDLLAERAASPRLRPVLRDVRDRVREGAALSEAFEKSASFPKIYTTALLAGEKSGNLSGVLDDYIAYQRVTTGVRKKLLAVLIYPAILVIVGSTILTYLVTYVVPQFAQLYKEMNVQLPGPTQFLTTLVVGYRYWVLAFVVALALAAAIAFLWSRTEQGGMAMDRFKLRIPIVGDTWIKFQVAQFTRTLATLLRGGTPLVPALVTSADSISSKLVAISVAQAAGHVREGESLSSSLAATGLMPSLALEMVEVGEASGALAPLLTSVATFYEEETSLRTAALIAVIEPVILVIMALVVAFVLLALYLPLFSLSVGAAG